MWDRDGVPVDAIPPWPWGAAAWRRRPTCPRLGATAGAGQGRSAQHHGAADSLAATRKIAVTAVRKTMAALIPAWARVGGSRAGPVKPPGPAAAERAVATYPTHPFVPGPVKPPTIIDKRVDRVVEVPAAPPTIMPALAVLLISLLLLLL